MTTFNPRDMARSRGQTLYRHRPGQTAPGAAADGIEADVRGDLVQPRSDERALEAVSVPPGAEERLLDGVIGLVKRGEHAVTVDVELAPVSLGEGREGGLPTGEGGRVLIGLAAASSSSFTTWTFQSRLTSWTSQVFPSGSWNGMKVA